MLRKSEKAWEHMIGSLRPSVGEGIELGQVESFGPY